MSNTWRMYERLVNLTSIIIIFKIIGFTMTSHSKGSLTWDTARKGGYPPRENVMEWETKETSEAKEDAKMKQHKGWQKF